MKDRGVDEQIASELLFVALEAHPDHLRLPGLVERIVSRDPARRREEEAAIERVLPTLKEEGLLREEDEEIAPTRAAIRFNEFCELIL